MIVRVAWKNTFRTAVRHADGMARQLIPVLFGLVTAVFILGVAALYQTTSHGSAIARPLPPAPQTPAVPAPVVPAPPAPLPVIEAGTWAAWALLDRGTDMITTAGGLSGTADTKSMIKVAIAAQYLSDLEVARRPPGPADLHLLSIMIRDSDNTAAETLYRRGGKDRMLAKVITTCGLHQTKTIPGRWSQTRTTPLDAVKMGSCIAAAKVCSQSWTRWLLAEMRQVRGTGRFGATDARPQDGTQSLAIKNGWLEQGREWHVSCLAIARNWVLAVMTRYPASKGLSYGASLCAAVTAAIAPPDTPA